MNAKPIATPLNDGWEYAMLTRDDGTPVPRPTAQRSLVRFKQAIARAGGRAPIGSDGQRQVWNEFRGWHDRSDRSDHYEPTRSPSGTTFLADAQRMQARVEADIAASRGDTPLGRRLMAERQARLEQERVVAERREAEAVQMYATASAAALAFMKCFVLGRVVSAHPSLDECVGKQLALAYPDGRPSLRAEQARHDRLGW
jgi:hypothetical protein